eukprot:TRINITY_DN5540_c0_g2_i1.p1 TRINITY_DN5540_c0_g2~~TRINITY_DN5540_c0_g2_i1.p1  ORF type:complete len:304 (+),score=144.47 TRINITY_DN5540_c0_g2_i1:136-912(+)
MVKSTTNKKSKRVMKAREKAHDLLPKGERSAQSKALLAKPLMEGGKTRYRGKTKRIKTVPAKPDAKAAPALGKGAVLSKLRDEVKLTEKEKELKKKQPPKPTIFKGFALDREQRAEVLQKETEHLEFVLGNDEFNEDPAAALLKHIDATLDPLKEAKGKHRYDPSRKKKLANQKEKEERAKRSTATGQLAQLTGHQAEIQKAISDHEAAKAKKASRTAGGKKEAGKDGPGARKAGAARGKPAGKGKRPGGDKPWLNPY